MDKLVQQVARVIIGVKKQSPDWIRELQDDFVAPYRASSQMPLLVRDELELELRRQATEEEFVLYEAKFLQKLRDELSMRCQVEASRR